MFMVLNLIIFELSHRISIVFYYSTSSCSRSN